MTKPLEGIRILEFTNAVAGPIAGAVLGDMGAEVIKVEAPNGRHTAAPDDRPPPEGVPDRPYNRQYLLNELNRSKRGVVLDVGRPEGRDLFLRLVAISDAVIENFSPRVVSRLGIDYPDLVQVKPDAILVSMPAFGKSGPYRDRRSYGPGIDAMSGLSHLTGYADGPPLKPGNFYCDQNAGMLAAYATLAAIWHRRRTGQGQYVELAMIEGELQLVAEALLDHVFNGRDQQRMGNRHPTMAPHGVYPCLGDDEWVALACRGDRDFAALCRVLGRPDLISDSRFATVTARKAHEDDLDAIVRAWTSAREHREAMEMLQSAGVPAGAALNVAELFEDPHVRARGLFEIVMHPEAGTHPHTRVGWKLRGTPSPIERPAPCFGQDNEYVLRQLLGLTEQEVGALVARGVVTTEPGLSVRH